MNNKEREWPAARVDELKTLVAQGLPYKEIGKRLGVSMSAALGKANRLDLDVRREPTTSTTLSRLNALNLFPGGAKCVFPEGDPGTAGFHFCDVPTASLDRPYCPEHTIRTSRS